ncbi:hypothetical protein K503DRAFT_785710 [Rhizopogon vinicolor AM-OR11-026]|uniref:Uncharacterized protein n=1 Tax=Rhizopogon vinicolor AM-OR11-026 TaxID=1314800 RepID=A0A1B7MPH2_9AGAM|nr:hypothetical protein K503DRAFT_785710 [Rhizopogon vinicolor AM-OR11-026]
MRGTALPTRSGSSQVELRLTPLSSCSSDEDSPDIVEPQTFVHLPSFASAPVRTLPLPYALLTPTPIKLSPTTFMTPNLPLIPAPALLPIISIPILSQPIRMPLCNSTTAPKFDGTTRDIVRYFEDKQIKAAFRHVNRDDAESWQTLDEADDDDFDTFFDAVKVLYPGCKSDKQYMRADLDLLAAEQATKPMQSQDDVAEYNRTFRNATKFLISKKRLAENE